VTCDKHALSDIYVLSPASGRLRVR
jgi:hypothetical protein